MDMLKAQPSLSTMSTHKKHHVVPHKYIQLVLVNYEFKDVIYKQPP